jgi:dihydrofolate reductase
MTHTQRPTTTAKVRWGFTMSRDGFVAGPNHDMSWMTGFTTPPELIDEYIETTGAVLAGRAGFDSAISDSRPWGGKWKGPILVLTHHPEDARSISDITILSCHVAEAVRVRFRPA